MQSREELEKIVADTTLSQAVRDQATRLLTNEFAGDEVAQKMIQLAKLLTPSGGGSGGNVDKSEVEDIVRDVIKSDKIDFDDLDSNLKSRISALPQQVQITITQKNVSKVISAQVNEGYVTPLIQKILSWLKSYGPVSSPVFDRYLYEGISVSRIIMKKYILTSLLEVI